MGWNCGPSDCEPSTLSLDQSGDVAAVDNGSIFTDVVLVVIDGIVFVYVDDENGDIESVNVDCSSNGPSNVAVVVDVYRLTLMLLLLLILQYCHCC